MLKLKKNYTNKKLIIPTQSLDDNSENYYIIDFERNLIDKIRYDTTAIQTDLLRFLNNNLIASDIPYGFSNNKSMIPYMIHPHSVTKISDHEIMIFFKQAPYFRYINLRSGINILYPDQSSICYDRIISSSSKTDENMNFYYSISSGIDRLLKYKNNLETIDFSIFQFNINSHENLSVSRDGHGLIDNIHETSCSTGNYIVLLDMNLSVNYTFDDKVKTDNEIIYSDDFRKDYSVRYFPIGRIFIFDLKTDKFYSIIPPIPTPAHVEFDPKDPTIFYVSCHNISKIKSKVILHGQAVLLKYQFDGEKIILLNQCTNQNFLRITTHRIFTYNGKTLIAVTGYPNILFIINAETMKIEKEIFLFEKTDENINFNSQHIIICSNDPRVSLFLDVEETGRYIFASTSKYVYIIDLEIGLVEETITFTEDKVIGTSHVILL